MFVTVRKLHLLHLSSFHVTFHPPSKRETFAVPLVEAYQLSPYSYLDTWKPW